mgnify:CR=1 FL=1
MRKVKRESFEINYDESLKRDFFRRDAEEVAHDLIGKVIVRKSNHGGYQAARIVETEAYLPENDKASHSARGKTPSNAAMFEEGGIAYVYRSYGIHFCLNFVSGNYGEGTGVLIRAAEPLLGIEEMIRNRGMDNIFRLCKGPGNLTQAFGIDIDDNFSSLLVPEFFVQKWQEIDDNNIIRTKRIGISKAKNRQLRFILQGSKFVSAKKS